MRRDQGALRRRKRWWRMTRQTRGGSRSKTTGLSVSSSSIHF